MVTQFMAILCAAGVTGCATAEREKFSRKVDSWKEVVHQVELRAKSPDLFAKDGPFDVNATEDYVIPLTPSNKVVADVFVPELKGNSPLVLMVHGNKFNRKVHASQCQRLASWGFNCATLEVPNEGQWLTNGTWIEKLVRIIADYPTLVSDHVDTKKIILIGHSFGGSAVTVATGNKAPVAGVILLDPAVVHPKVRDYMEGVEVPVILLGADPGVFASRKRKLFYKNIAGPMSEVSISGATHNDAQLPSIDKVAWGFDLSTTERYQATFLRSIVASAFSLGGFSSLDFAWKTFEPYIRAGLLKSGKIRAGKQKQEEFNR
jgi:dienelactone hydrolase